MEVKTQIKKIKKNSVKKQLENWKNKLIDFSRRNQLLYFKPRASLSIEIFESAAEIFKKLVLEAKGLSFKHQIEEFQSFDLPGDEEEPPPGFLPGESAPGDDLGLDSFALSDEDSSSDSSLQTNKDEKTLSRSLSNLRTRSKASLNEQGVNILYLALNFLDWYDSASPGTGDGSAKSPLILLPVSLDRKGLSGTYRLNLIDDEIRINPTLSYKLLRDYGIDFNKIEAIREGFETIESPEDFQELSEQIQALISGHDSKTKDWKVVDESSLSLFSFAKLSLYKDLEQNEERILLHPIVRQIAGEMLDESELYPKGFSAHNLIKAEDFDKKVDALRLNQVLDADSSQQEAIEAAKAGQSFVIQGPPGTGKSQTISNIIAEALAQGKKVLFVSEKKAALDVVVKRLSESKLNNFCLELHGSSQKKSEIIQGVKKSLDDIKSLALDSKRSTYLDDVNEIKKNIQVGVDELHKLRQPVNMSLYEIYGALSKLERQLQEAAEQEAQSPMVELLEPGEHNALVKRAPVEDYRVKWEVNFTIKNLERITEKELSEFDYFFSQLEKKSEILNDYPNFIWRNANLEQLSFELENEIKSNFLEFQRILRKLKAYADPISKRYFNREVNSLREFKWLAEACKLTVDSPFPKREWFDKGRFGEVQNLTAQARSKYVGFSETKSQVLSHYSEKFLDLDHVEMLDRFQNRYASGGMFRFFDLNYWKDMAQIKKTSLLNESRDLKALISDLKTAAELDKQNSEMQQEDAQLSLKLGDFYKKFDTNWDETITALKWVEKVMGQFDSEIPKALIDVVSSSHDEEDYFDFKASAQDLVQAYEVAKFHIKHYREIFPNPNVDIFAMDFEDLIMHLEDLNTNITKIEDWVEFRTLQKKAETLGLKQFLDALLSNPANSNSKLLQKRFLLKFYQLWADKIEIENPAMRKFSGHEQQLLIEKFVDIDRKQISKVQSDLARRLSMNWIEFASSPVHQEALQLLNAELNKKKRHKPIRLLVKEIPELLQTLKPCWMMSPLSVSQLIDSEAIETRDVEFDMVIFDEASQIRTEDAICSIYRGKQLILAGDTNQLPPTNFFSYIEDKNDDDYEENHFESVLDECSVFLTDRTLNWHYRSRHESLIGFSNYHIYDNKLIAFPSPVKHSEKLGVHFSYVDGGKYERGARYNRKEAKAVAEAVFKHFEITPKKSLGVIAFSEAQQDAIERELAALLRKQPEFEKHFNEEQTDAFFVKNLENVQGDERDVIFFSIGYARDRKGNLSHNFGPLNREGGHRRLNVAITRAREKLTVYSSIYGSDIDPQRTSAQGAILLKKYLAYAQFCSAQMDKEAEVDSDELKKFELDLDFLLNNDLEEGAAAHLGIEDSIALAIESRGYVVTKFLGNSDYKIDLAISSKRAPDKYKLAIETDGRMYRAAKTIRDRERLRRQVLESLGWKVHRVYARDWIRNQAKELEAILELL